ncbi:hypothetical protein [Nocardia jiangxiensis]|uniref:hypothetical protein n=1 Tax=Nocardia jiangxiensis TaxID=282685 RepID=UPI0012F6BA7E|nr:hypothetical protein [Nocardia jiangxiensis]
MTSLVVWVAVDQRGPASMYIATDSRISWSGGQRLYWDHGRKTYAAALTSNIIGYVGDVLYPALSLPTVLALLDELPPASTGDLAQRQVLDLVQAAWEGAPAETRSYGTELVHCARIGDGMQAEFVAQILRLPKGSSKWESVRLSLPPVSSKLEFLGSGSRALKAAYGTWIRPTTNDDRDRTSRAVFSAFCDAVGGGSDEMTGGPPQLVGLYRKGPARVFGVHWNGRAYLHGTEVPVTTATGFEYRNSRFERVDASGVLIPRAQRHAAQPAT